MWRSLPGALGPVAKQSCAPHQACRLCGVKAALLALPKVCDCVLVVVDALFKPARRLAWGAAGGLRRPGLAWATSTTGGRLSGVVRTHRAQVLHCTVCLFEGSAAREDAAGERRPMMSESGERLRGAASKYARLHACMVKGGSETGWQPCCPHVCVTHVHASTFVPKAVPCWQTASLCRARGWVA